MDCTSSVHGYQADITRTFVFGADPAPEQRKLWDQVHRGQDIAMAAAKVGRGREGSMMPSPRLRKLGMRAGI